MTATAPVGTPPTNNVRWYALPPEEVAGRLGVDASAGLPGATAAQRLTQNGPNALPAEKPPPGWRRFLAQYAAYMQIILVIAGVLSLAIGQWSTGAPVLH